MEFIKIHSHEDVKQDPGIPLLILFLQVYHDVHISLVSID